MAGPFDDVIVCSESESDCHNRRTSGTSQTSGFPQSVTSVHANLDFKALWPAAAAAAEAKGKEETHTVPAKVTLYDNRDRTFLAKRRRCNVDSAAASKGLGATGGRIETLMAAKTCKCSRGSCFTQFSDRISDLLEFTGGFSKLDTPFQNICIRAAVQDASIQTPRKISWLLLGKHVGVDCLVSLLGIHKRRLHDSRFGKVDLRRGPKPRVAPKAIDIDLFFLDLYISVGECLPDKFIRRGARLHGRLFQQIHGVELSETSSDEEATQERNLADLDRDLALWYSHSVTGGNMQASVCTLNGMDISSLEKRKLPPGNISSLYAHYLLQRGALTPQRPGTSRKSQEVVLADVSSEEDTGSVAFHEHHSAAGWTLFYKRWHDKWRFVLEFKHESHHATCDDCFHFKQATQGWLSKLQSDLMSETFQSMQEYQRHLAATTADRAFGTSLRLGAERGSCSGHPDYFFIIADGMDQAKWRLPRFPELKTPKSAAHIARPTVIVEGVWIVGHRIDFYLLDKNQHHDSNSIQECIALSLEKAIASLTSRGIDVPRCCIYLADNTVRESKNQFMLKYWAVHVARKKFDLCIQMHMRAGHTHDVLGAPARVVVFLLQGVA